MGFSGGGGRQLFDQTSLLSKVALHIKSGSASNHHQTRRELEGDKIVLFVRIAQKAARQRAAWRLSMIFGWKN